MDKDRMKKRNKMCFLRSLNKLVKFVFFLAHLLFQTKGNLKNPLKKSVFRESGHAC